MTARACPTFPPIDAGNGAGAKVSLCTREDLNIQERED